MRIGVLGSGIVGQTLAAGAIKHGHAVMLGTRDPKSKDVMVSDKTWNAVFRFHVPEAF